MLGKMRYRLGLDLGTSSLGWSMVRLNDQNEPCAIIKAGVRIFSDGRNPKDGSSLAVTRRVARQMRRRRDRLLKRKARLLKKLIEYGFLPEDKLERKALERMNPFELRAKGLEQELELYEFGRAIFHLNQRRGFKSNRKSDKKDGKEGSSALKSSINATAQQIEDSGLRTVGEWLYHRLNNNEPVKARYRETRIEVNGKTRIQKSYDLYINRQMVADEFEALWNAQAKFNPKVYSEAAHDDLIDTILYQRELLPVKPGRCTFFPEEERAPKAMPLAQRFRMYQEVNNLRIVRDDLTDQGLTKEQRDRVIEALESNKHRTFGQLKKLLGLPGGCVFNLEDERRGELKGNETSSVMRRKDLFGKTWDNFDLDAQNEIVSHLLNEESEEKLISWLIDNTDVTAERAGFIADASLVDGYGNLSVKALELIVPELTNEVVTYVKAVRRAGFEDHTQLSPLQTGEILEKLPYYGEVLSRHVGFGTGDPNDPVEARYGKIANPTVHIGLNQVRLVVNALIERYGHPSEIIVELARDLKQSQTQRAETKRTQRLNQENNERRRKLVSEALGVLPENVRRADIQKVLLWEELSSDPLTRCCPYTGAPISMSQLLSDAVEIEHILPFSRSLDDSLNNKVVSFRAANRIKGNDTPWEAFGKQDIEGYDYEAILSRASLMPKSKAFRFAKDGMERWLKDHQGFLARALNDTRYLSRIARLYLQHICPGTRAIPGQMTAMLRGKFGLNSVLGGSAKNRDDHRHHAIDACVVAVTDQGLLQRFAKASASARRQNLDRLVEDMPLPWGSYRKHVERAVGSIRVSHKPDHSYEGAMHNETAYGLLPDGTVRHTVYEDGKRIKKIEKIKVVAVSSTSDDERHGRSSDGLPVAYKGYKPDGNYCMDIYLDEKGKWDGKILSTFEAYSLARKFGADAVLEGRTIQGYRNVMRLRRNDVLRIKVDSQWKLFLVQKMASPMRLFLVPLNEANADARVREKLLKFKVITPSGLQKQQAKVVSVGVLG